jgi:hypothetical protein
LFNGADGQESRGTAPPGLFLRRRPLDRYLQTRAARDICRRIAHCFVATPANSNSIARYYTFSAASVPMLDLPSENRKNACRATRSFPPL